MSTIDKLNTIEVEDILKALWIRYNIKWGTFSLYEGNKVTGGWKAHRDGKFTDFSEKGRAKWDRLEFIWQYLNCNKHDALLWVEETFSIENDFVAVWNPIKDKWEALPELSLSHIEYLKKREIDYEKIKWIVRLNWNNLCLPIRSTSWTIKSLQSRSIGNTGSRYYVEANTDSDWIFFNWLNEEKKALLVVEGFTDFLSLRQYTTNVVWLLNAKNDWQLKMIKDLSLKYTIFFIPDNDEAWKVTIEKFNQLWIRFNLFDMSSYWVKDINELMVGYNTGEWILKEIFSASIKPPSNLQSALEKAKGYREMYEQHNWKLGFPSWYEKLDKYTDWIIKWKVYMIMAYSNVGKTRFAYSLLKNFVEQKKKIHFYSLEVDTWMLFIEMIGAVKGLNKQQVIESLDDIDLEELEKSVEIYDSIRTLEQIEQSIKNEKPDVAIIDFVQNIEQQGREYDKMTEIALRIQKLAILTGTTIIQLSQVSNESRFADWNNILPKGSWALFASSDVIFTLWVRDWQRYLTLSKNKYWPAWINFLLEIDYAKSEFRMTEDTMEEAGFKGI